MNQNNFFIVFAIVILLGINSELYSSERSTLGSSQGTFDMSLLYEQAMAQRGSGEKKILPLYRNGAYKIFKYVKEK